MKKNLYNEFNLLIDDLESFIKNNKKLDFESSSLEDLDISFYYKKFRFSIISDEYDIIINEYDNFLESNNIEEIEIFRINHIQFEYELKYLRDIIIRFINMKIDYLKYE